MVERIARFPFWEIAFDEDGRHVAPAGIDAMVGEVAQEGVTDLFVFSHGWNSSRASARALYERFFDQLRAVLARPDVATGRQSTIGTAGVIWPSMRWADEEPPADAGGAAGLTDAPSDRSDPDMVRALKAVFRAPQQQQALDDLAQLLDDRPPSEAALRRFQERMRALAIGQDAAPAPEDQGEKEGLLEQPAEAVFERMAAAAPATEDEGGAAFLDAGDRFDSLWNGAKQALRQLTYYEMKKRAGVVGQRGLGPLVGRLHERQADLRVHLLGHSFGARLVAFALAGLPAGASPVKSVFLLQGAFSHFAFADSLPHAPGRGGALAGLASRVDGPLLVSHSRLDTAVGRWYPLASLAAGQDAAGIEDPLYPWGAMGYDGAQAVEAVDREIGEVGTSYPFEPGGVLNLNGNDLIVNGEPPSGAHGDIIYPQIAWVALSAAGITAPP